MQHVPALLCLNFKILKLNVKIIHWLQFCIFKQYLENLLLHYRTYSK